jgi:type IV pilus assembly protein PilC
MTAIDEREVEERLRLDGTYLVRAELRQGPARKRTDGHVDRKDLLALLEYLAGGAQIGMPILTTLLDVESRLDSDRLRQIVRELRASMGDEGRSLSEAMAEHPKAFPLYYVSSIQAGEASGQLDYVLRQLVEHMDWQENVTSQLRQSLTYPTVIVVAVVGLLLVLVAFVFPRLIPTLTGRGGPVPLPTRIVIGVAGIIQGYWQIVAFTVAAAVVTFVVARRSPGGGIAIDRFLLRLPGIGQLIMETNMARMVTYLGLFYRSGVEFLYSLRLIEGMMGNRAVAAAVGVAREGIAGGDSISAAFARSSVFPPIVLRSLALGESTGHLDESLARTQAYYAREVPAAVRRMITVLQPVLIAVLGGAVLLVALAIFLPILGIYESIGRRR